jgi:hypothetical protein
MRVTRERLLPALTVRALDAATFRQQLRDDEPRLYRFSEAHLGGQDATPFANAGEDEYDSCDLVGVGVDLRRALRRSVATLLVGASQPNEVLGSIATLSRVEGTGGPLQRGHCRYSSRCCGDEGTGRPNPVRHEMAAGLPRARTRLGFEGRMPAGRRARLNADPGCLARRKTCAARAAGPDARDLSVRAC